MSEQQRPIFFLPGRLIDHTGHTQIIYDNEELDTGFPNCRRQPLPRLGTEIKRMQITKAYVRTYE